MPCPPSYEERRVIELDYSISQWTQSNGRLKEQLAQLMLLISQVGTDSIGPETLQAYTRLKEHLLPGSDKYSRKSSSQNWELNEEMLADLEAEALFLQQYHEHAELTLCILRTWLMDTYWDDHHAFQAEFEREKALHLEHRREEHTLLIQGMEQQLSETQRLLDLNPTFEPMISRVSSCKLALAKLRSVSDEDLLRNRRAGID